MLPHDVEIDQYRSLARQQDVAGFKITMRNALMPQLAQDLDYLAQGFFDFGMGNITFEMI